MSGVALGRTNTFWTELHWHDTMSKASFEWGPLGPFTTEFSSLGSKSTLPLPHSTVWWEELEHGPRGLLLLLWITIFIENQRSVRYYPVHVSLSRIRLSLCRVVLKSNVDKLGWVSQWCGGGRERIVHGDQVSALDMFSPAEPSGGLSHGQKDGSVAFLSLVSRSP